MLKYKRLHMVITVLMFLGAPLLAQAEIGFKGIGGQIGIVDVAGGGGTGTTIGFGVLADLGTITPDIQLGANVDFFSKSFGVVGAEASFRDISLGATGRYLFPGASFTPFVSGGVAIHLYKASSTVPDVVFNGVVISQGGEFSASSTEFGIDLGGGAMYPANDKVDLIGEFKYRIVDGSYWQLMVGAVVAMGD